MSKKKLRRVGDIMLDMEKLLFELHIDHDMQHQEVLGLIHWWQRSHVPGQAPEYVNETLVPSLRMKSGWFPDYGPIKKKESK